MLRLLIAQYAYLPRNNVRAIRTRYTRTVRLLEKVFPNLLTGVSKSNEEERRGTGDWSECSCFHCSIASTFFSWFHAVDLV